MKYLICLSGVTGAGKTTLSLMLFHFLIDPKNMFFFDPLRIDKVDLIHQDNYYLLDDHPNHTLFPGTNLINYEVLSALDMDKITKDVEDTIANRTFGSPETINFLIVEGYTIYNEPRINKLCDIRLQLNLTYDEALKRRRTRTDRTTDNSTEIYFVQNIWSYFLINYKGIPNKNELIYLNGELNITHNFDLVIETVKNKLK